jgi:hypothetical protein
MTMSASELLQELRRAAEQYVASDRQLRSTVSAAREAGVPITSIAEAAGVTRQTVYNWLTEQGTSHRLVVPARPELLKLATQRPAAPPGTPVLLLNRLRRRSVLVWDGRAGESDGYTDDRLRVGVHGRVTPVLADSWALVGDSTGRGDRPGPGVTVIRRDGTLATVHRDSPAGDLLVDANGTVSRCSWWATLHRTR